MTVHCHACEAPMHLDHYGHPVHDGLCPGYPVQECENCGHEVPGNPGNLSTHHRYCTPDAPKPPNPVRMCPVCTLRHSPACEGRTWPLSVLLASLPNPEPDPNGTPIPVGTNHYAAMVGVGTKQLYRYAVSGIPTDVADRWACRLEKHPSNIWTDWFDDVSILDERRAAGGWRHVWLANEPAGMATCAPVAPLDPVPHPSTGTNTEPLTTQHRRSA